MRHPEVVLKLRSGDRKRLNALEKGLMTNRTWLRLKIVRLLGHGRCVQDVADGLGTYPRVVRRVRDEYTNHGLEAWLHDHVRANHPKPRLDDGQRAKIVALACSSP